MPETIRTRAEIPASYKWKHQPMLYAQYSLFVAEVASNFHRYFFIMPILAQFELEVHQRVERGQGVTAADMNALMADLFAEGYGSEMDFDRDRTGITWPTFGHRYQDYYVYQYAIGLSAAHALSRRILAGTKNAAANYIRFLSAGASLYPLDALKLAGVDMSTSQPVEETFEVLAEMVDRLEELTRVNERSTG